MESWSSVLGPLLSGDSLSKEQSGWAMEQIMTGQASGAQFGAFVAGLRAKGATVEEMLGLVEIMRAFSLKVDPGFEVVDTCGTGGDGSNSINISTISAFVVAGAGAKVAKHGNRAASSACGSADLLEELGVRVDLGPAEVRAAIRIAGVGFCMAPVFHPAMKHAGAFRRELGVPTIFNFLGPLTNPAGALHQAVGVSDRQMAPKMAEVLRRLGTVHALVFIGFDGLDELSIGGPSYLWELKDGEVTESVFDPSDFGFEKAEIGALKGAGPAENARVAREVLSGKPGPARDVVIINSAAAIIAAGLDPDFDAATGRARDSIDSGAAAKALQALIDFSAAPTG